ncbi:MAG: RNA polymerase sigma factor [bacterium]|nr:RNA polymerase sigma factor [bacterium]
MASDLPTSGNQPSDVALDLPIHLIHASRSPEGPATATSSPDLSPERLTAEEPRLRRLIHRLLGWPTSRVDVDDIVQETLLAAWSNRRRFRAEASVTTWLHAIAVNQTRRHERAARRRRRFFRWFGAASEPTTIDTPNDATELATTSTQRALRLLAHDQREILVLRYLEQQPIPTIADLLGCTRNAADARLTRARRKLRALLHGSSATAGTDQPA